MLLGHDKREVFMFSIPNTALSIEKKGDTLFVYWGSHGEVCSRFINKESRWYEIDDDNNEESLVGEFVQVVGNILDLISELVEEEEYYLAESIVRFNLLGDK